MKTNKEKTRKILMLLPFIIIPLAAGIFWVIKNSNNKMSMKDAIAFQNRFNAMFPEPNVDNKDKTKLEVYMQSKKDSLAKQEQLTNEELQKKYYDPGPPEEKRPDVEKKQKKYALKDNITTTDANELRVNEHLQKLYAQLDNANPKSAINDPSPDVHRATDNKNIEHLEEMLATAQKTDTNKDAELSQIDTMLNKMLDIAHPERVKERAAGNKLSKPQNVYFVSTNPEPLNDPTADNENNFYDLESNTTSPEKEKQESTIMAVIHQDKWVHDGSSVKMRLLQDIYINGICIPHGNFIYGQCALSNDRVTIYCKNVSFNNIIYPISLTVYDLDGIEGVNAPGAISAETTKEGLNQGLQNMQLLNVDPSIGAQAASAGVQTAKTLLSKKIRTVQVKLKGNHNVLLKTSNI